MARRPSARRIAVLLAVLGALAIASLAAGAAEADRIVRSTPIGTGDLAPDFTLLDQDGKPHTLSAERVDKRAVVLVFYRGYW
jgi:cytochrome oxidase Cu insertion factor (SCO1/SenC/PrrC family)